MLSDKTENKLAVQIENGILKHFSTIEFERYFLKIKNDKLDFVRNYFLFFLKKLSNEWQDKFLKLINVSLVRQAYHERLLTQFGIEMKDFYSKTTKKALRTLIPYMSTYLYEAGFSTQL